MCRFVSIVLRTDVIVYNAFVLCNIYLHTIYAILDIKHTFSYENHHPKKIHLQYFQEVMLIALMWIENYLIVNWTENNTLFPLISSKWTSVMS